MTHRIFAWLTALFMLAGQASAQDLLQVLDKDNPPVTDYATGTFKATHLVIGQSVETTPAGNLQFLISHHFGRINGGYQNIYGLNTAFIRIGAEYGFTDWLTAGVGLNTYEITWDGYAKIKFFRQSKGERKMPFTLTGFAGMAAQTVKWSDPSRKNYNSSRLSYAFELMLARKFNDWFSLQLTPSLVHINLVPTASDHNDIYSISLGGRIKITDRLCANAEYYYVFPGQINTDANPRYNSLSVGIDIETGGHVFQIFVTNSEGLIEESFIPYSLGKWAYGNIYLGFTISRMLTIIESKM